MNNKRNADDVLKSIFNLIKDAKKELHSSNKMNIEEKEVFNVKNLSYKKNIDLLKKTEPQKKDDSKHSDWNNITFKKINLKSNKESFSKVKENNNNEMNLIAQQIIMQVLTYSINNTKNDTNMQIEQFCNLIIALNDSKPTNIVLNVPYHVNNESNNNNKFIPSMKIYTQLSELLHEIECKTLHLNVVNAVDVKPHIIKFKQGLQTNQ
mgnify:CR=1 FL=1